MCRKKIIKIIAILTLGLSLISCKPSNNVKLGYTNIPSYTLNEENITYRNFEISDKIENIKPKVLIYHTHTLEDYTNSNVVKMGEDLANKLRDKGFIVDHITDNFSKDYNNAYNCSREYLQGLDLSQYNLILDYHRDSLNNPNTSKVYNKDVAKIMLVYGKASGNYNTQKDLGNQFISKMESDLVRSNWIYDTCCFNQDLNDNILLLEMGNHKNSEIEIMRLNTHLSNSINKVLKLK